MIAVVVLATVATVLLTGHSRPHPYAFRRAWLWRHRLVAGGGVLLTLLSLWAVASRPGPGGAALTAGAGADGRTALTAEQPVDVP